MEMHSTRYGWKEKMCLSWEYQDQRETYQPFAVSWLGIIHYRWERYIFKYYIINIEPLEHIKVHSISVLRMMPLAQLTKTN